MKFTIAAFFMGLMSLSAASTYSQNTKISLNIENATLIDVFKQIEAQSEFVFIYKNETINLDKKVDVKVEGATVDKILENVLQNSGVKFEINNKQIIVTPERLIPSNKNEKFIKEEIQQPQKKEISGMVKDNKGLSIPGLSVVVKGTTTGTVTDTNGKFTLFVPTDAKTLVFSFVGMKAQEFAITGKTSFNVVMEEETVGIEEVVAIGYGTVRKSDVTGSVSSISTKDMGNKSASNIGQLIQGKASGVEVYRDGGRPGASTNIKIRGTTSLNSTGPLTIIDGMIGDLDMVSTNEIEHVEILKDASSTAIYGARGANGVIIVTTKKGAEGSPKINYNVYFGVATPGKQMNVLKASDYVDLIYDIKGGQYSPTTGKWDKPTGLPVFFNDDTYARTDRTDWQKEVFQNGFVQEHNFDVSGGTSKASYRLSVGHLDQESTVKSQKYYKNTIKLNNEFRPYNFITFGSNIMLRIGKTKGELIDFAGVVNSAPYQPIKDPTQGNVGDYSYTTTPDNLNDQANPMSIYEYQLKNNSWNQIKMQIQFFGEVKIMNDLKFRSQFQYDRNQNHTMNYTSANIDGPVPTKMQFGEGYSLGMGQKWENYFTYNKVIGIHNFTTMAGINYEDNNWGRSLNVSTSDFINMNVLLPTFGKSTPTLSAGAWHSASLSYFGRLNYTLSDKYLFTANFRSDASYKFAPANRWGYFPSLALAWKMHEEPFMKGNAVISMLKPRISWGKAGNDAIPEYRFFSNVWTGANNNVYYPLGTTYGFSTMANGATVNALSSIDIRWEETTTTDLGLDLGLFKNSLNFTLDYYDKYTSGVLVDVPIPLSTGISSPAFKNAADVSNKGFDFQISYKNQVSKDFSYDILINGGYNINKVESLGEGQPIMGASGITRTMTGYPIGNFYGYKTDGVISTTAEAVVYNKKFGLTAEAGDLRFKDLNSDGYITDADRTFLGNAMPDFSYGASVNLIYKGIDLQANISGFYGNEIYNNAKNFPTSMTYTYNALSSVLSRWKQEGQLTDMPRAVQGDPNKNSRVSDRYVEDGSFARLRNITLGYTINNSWLKRKSFNYISNLRIYITGENIYTFTKYTGYDPEAGGGRSNTDRGVDYGTFPMPKTYLTGIQISF